MSPLVALRATVGYQRIMTWLNDNASAIQAIGSVGAIFVAIVVAGWQTWVARCDQKAARRRSARVLAMELLPIVKAIHGDLELALALGGWEAPHHLNVAVLQERRIGGADALERAVDRLAVLDDETIRPLLGVVSAMRDYHCRLQSEDIRRLEAAAVVRDLDQRKRWLEAAKRHAVEAVTRLGEVARV